MSGSSRWRNVGSFPSTLGLGGAWLTRSPLAAEGSTHGIGSLGGRHGRAVRVGAAAEQKGKPWSVTRKRGGTGPPHRSEVAAPDAAAAAEVPATEAAPEVAAT